MADHRPVREDQLLRQRRGGGQGDQARRRQVRRHLGLHAAKLYADGEGAETPTTLDDWVEVGVFGKSPTGEEADEPVLYLERHRITEGAPNITVTVDAEPYEAGFDPYNKLIDRVSVDNRKRVEVEN